MIVLRCTQRLLKLSGQKPAAELPAPTAILGEWYANVFGLPFRGKAAVLYVDNPARLAVIVPGRSLRTTIDAFRARVPVLLEQIGIDPGSIQSEQKEMKEVAIGNPQDRSILGTMNDMKQLICYHAEEAGSMERFDVHKVELRFSRMPHVSVSIYPHEAVRKLFFQESC